MDKLCGGTLLVLLVNSSKDKVSETSLLANLLKILDPSLYTNDPYLKISKDKFKKCNEHSSLATPFENSLMQNKLTENIDEKYCELLKRTTKFIEDYIDTNSDIHKDEILVKAIIEVIEQDSSITENQKFYILPNGKPVTKAKLISMKKIYLPSFLLGILYYVMMNICDNKEGAKTYEKWCPKPKSGTQRKYTANIGENSNRQIELLDAPDKYDRYELSDLAGELITLFVKPTTANNTHDIATTSLIADDIIDDSERADYVELTSSISDIKKLKNFIDDCNTLICCVNKYKNSSIIDDVDSLGHTKDYFFHKWISLPYRFDDISTHKWVDYILSRIEQSDMIDINNIDRAAIPIQLNISQIPVLELKYRFPKTKNVAISEQNKNDDVFIPESDISSE